MYVQVFFFYLKVRKCSFITKFSSKQEMKTFFSHFHPYLLMMLDHISLTSSHRLPNQECLLKVFYFILATWKFQPNTRTSFISMVEYFTQFGMSENEWKFYKKGPKTFFSLILNWTWFPISFLSWYLFAHFSHLPFHYVRNWTHFL